MNNLADIASKRWEIHSDSLEFILHELKPTQERIFTATEEFILTRISAQQYRPCEGILRMGWRAESKERIDCGAFQFPVLIEGAGAIIKPLLFMGGSTLELNVEPQSIRHIGPWYITVYLEGIFHRRYD